MSDDLKQPTSDEMAVMEYRLIKVSERMFVPVSVAELCADAADMLHKLRFPGVYPAIPESEAQ